MVLKRSLILIPVLLICSGIFVVACNIVEDCIQGIGIYEYIYPGNDGISKNGILRWKGGLCLHQYPRAYEEYRN